MTGRYVVAADVFADAVRASFASAAGAFDALNGELSIRRDDCDCAVNLHIHLGGRHMLVTVWTADGDVEVRDMNSLDDDGRAGVVVDRFSVVPASRCGGVNAFARAAAVDLMTDITMCVPDL